LCSACLLQHNCPAEQGFNTEFLKYKCTFTGKNSHATDSEHGVVGPHLDLTPNL
jgi:hypothetical protein